MELSGLATKKKRERRPRSLATHRGSPENFVGEEAPEAREGPRTPWDNRLPRRKGPVYGTNRLLEIKIRFAIYPTGEEAVAALKPYRYHNNEMEHQILFSLISASSAVNNSDDSGVKAFYLEVLQRPANSQLLNVGQRKIKDPQWLHFNLKTLE